MAAIAANVYALHRITSAAISLAAGLSDGGEWWGGVFSGCGGDLLCDAKVARALFIRTVLAAWCAAQMLLECRVKAAEVSLPDLFQLLLLPLIIEFFVSRSATREYTKKNTF